MNDIDTDTLNKQLDTVIDQLMTTEEAATLWRMHQDHIKRLCSTGQVAARKKGKTWWLLREQPNPKQRERNSNNN
jgi:hypothetical protein